MSLETGAYPADLVVTNPDGADSRTTSDDHLRLLKKTIKNAFAGFTGGVVVTGTDSGAVNAYTVTPTNSLPSYTSRLSVIFSPSATNTSTATVNVSGLGAKDIKRIDGSALVAGDLVSGSIYVAIYNGTEFRLMAPTKNYIDQLSLGTAYPASPADSGKFLKYTGSAYAWAAAGIASAATTSSAASFALTSTAAGYQSVAMTAMGKHVTLPDATTMTVGGPWFILKNDGGYPFGIRDNAGTLIIAVAAGGIAYVTLKDNSTAAGSWSVIGDNLEPGLITIDSTFSSTYSSTVLAPFVALDANTSIHFAALSSVFAAFVVDNAGKVIGTPVTVDATASAAPNAVFKVSSTSAVLFYNAAGVYKVVVLTVTGTSISVGSAASSPDNNAWSVEDSTGAPKVAQLSSALYLVSYTQTGATKAVAISVSGAIATIGTAVNIIASSSVSHSTTTYALTATTALVVYLSGGGPYAVNAVVVSVSGTTCTVGSPAAVATFQAQTASAPSSCLLSATKALVAFNYNGTQAYAAAITVSGASVACGTAVAVDTLTGAAIAYTEASATRYNPHLSPLSASTALLWYLDSSGISRAVVLSESGGTVTAGTKVFGSISSGTDTAASAGKVLGLGATEFVAVVKETIDTSNSPIRLQANKVSGTAVTQGSARSVHGVYCQGISAVVGTRLSSGKYLIFGVTQTNTASSSIQVTTSNGDALAPVGTISMPAVSSLPTVIPPHFSNRMVLLVPTVFGSTISASTSQLRLLNVEIAA